MSEAMTIERLFQEMGNYVDATSPPYGVEAGWGRLKRVIEQEQARIVEQRSAVVDAGRARWGRGFTIGITEGAWTSATDGHGRLVAPEDWGVFRAYLEAADAEKFAAIASMRGPW